MNKPPGFTEAVENATNGSGDFLKVGVGILRKNTATYNWAHNYPVVELAKTEATWDTHGDRVTFVQTLKGTANGYACELEAVLRLRNNQMLMQYRLKNTGQKRLVTEQYVHNFLAFSGAPVGPHYEIRFPYDFQLEGNPSPAIRRSQGSQVLEFWKALPAAVKFRVAALPGYTGPNTLTVTQTKLKQTATIEASLPSNGVDLWCTDRQISPEMLVLLALDPGQEQHWTRTYKFSGTPNLL
jgi:hypothetical protein